MYINLSTNTYTHEYHTRTANCFYSHSLTPTNQELILISSLIQCYNFVFRTPAQKYF